MPTPSFFTIAKEYDTPFYLYDQAVLQDTYQNLRAVFPSVLEIFYSLKANPNLALCGVLQKLGAGAEVCSLVELETAIRVGFTPQNIIFLGPAKTEDEIAACIKLGIAAIVCESKNEFNRINLLAQQQQKQVNVALRINPNFVSKTASLKMGGQASQFGMDEDLVLAEYEFFFNQPAIKIIGIHVYNGTRILDPQTVFDNTRSIFELFEKITACSKQTLTFLDIGGGLGVPYFDQEQAVNLQQLKNLLEPIILAWANQFPTTRLILETGRFLLAPAGVFVSRIVDKKVSKGETYLITDGGTNCHMAAVGLGSFVKRNFPISLLSQDAETKSASCDKTNLSISADPLCVKSTAHNASSCVQIVGPLCTPGDLLAKNIQLPDAAIGDLIVVHHSGAYGLTASPVLFLSHGFPAELLLHNNQVHLIRARQTMHDFFNNQFLLGEI